MRCIVDTNVPIVANGRGEKPAASSACMVQCAQRLGELTQSQILVLDDQWHILREYMKQLNQSGQPGVGDAFIKWVLTNLTNATRIEMVSITKRAGSDDPDDFAEFPDDPNLATFDRSDRKFVAVAVAHPNHPPILNGVDSDWWHYRAALRSHGVVVEFLCPDAMPG
jgi:hypothetical protein